MTHDYTLCQEMTKCSGIRRNAKHLVTGFCWMFVATCPTKLCQVFRSEYREDTHHLDVLLLFTLLQQKHSNPTDVQKTSWIGKFLQWKKGQDWGHHSSPTVYIPTWLVKSDIKLLPTKKATKSLTEVFLFFSGGGTAARPQYLPPPWESRPLPRRWSQWHPQNRIGSGKYLDPPSIISSELSMASSQLPPRGRRPSNNSRPKTDRTGRPNWRPRFLVVFWRPYNGELEICKFKGHHNWWIYT